LPASHAPHNAGGMLAPTMTLYGNASGHDE
jgi:hypothetical protein